MWWFNLTTSGSAIIETNEVRLAHLKKLRPEMCSYDAGTFNWNNGGVFVNAPDFLEQLSACVLECGIKPEFEIFDNGMIGNALYYIQKYQIPNSLPLPVCSRRWRRRSGYYKEFGISERNAASRFYLVRDRNR